MTATEKADIYNFLSTALATVSGFRSNEKDPNFSDSPIRLPTITVLVIGKPLSHDAGILLHKMLAAINLESPKNCKIIEKDLITIQSINEELLLTMPYAILILGKHFQIDTQNESTFVNFQGIPLLAIEDPELILHKPQLKRPAWEDLKLLKAEIDRIITGDS